MSNKSPSFRAYAVSTPKRQGEKGFFREVGVIWPHSKGNGFYLVVHEGMSVHGRIVCLEPKKNGEQPDVEQ